MHLPHPLLEGRLLRRYQRFFAEVQLPDERVVTAHTPNTGSMRQCAVPGHRVLLSTSTNPARKLPYTWELVEVNGALVAKATVLQLIRFGNSSVSSCRGGNFSASRSPQ